MHGATVFAVALDLFVHFFVLLVQLLCLLAFFITSNSVFTVVASNMTFWMFYASPSSPTLALGCLLLH